MSSEREGDWQRNAQKIRIDVTEKNSSINEWIPCTFGVYLSVGCCISQSIARSVSGTWRFKKCLFWQKKSLKTPLRSVVHPESLKSLNDDIQQERRVRQQHRTESLKHWMTAFQQDVTCASHWRGLLLLYMYSIDYIHFLSTTKHQPEMPDYVNNNNISGTCLLYTSPSPRD